MSFINLSEQQVKEILEWPLVYDAIEQALRSITETRTDESQPTFNQPTRIFTVPPNGKGVLLSMPGFIGNYRLKKSGRQNKENTKILNTLACKLVTSFSGNRNLNPPKPNIIGNIFMFNENTGELRAMLGATEITAWRTAAASLVATDYLFLKRTNVDDSPKTIAIIGCGVQGRIHAFGLCSLFNISHVRLWNRTRNRADDLVKELLLHRHEFKNQQVDFQSCDSVESCARDADIIVTATSSSSPLLFRSMIKENVHINAVGAAATHVSEINMDVYHDKATQIYVDNFGSARTEMKTLTAPIVGEVGDIINQVKPTPTSGITIFHSMGMAVEDAAVAEAVLEKHLNNL